MRIATDVVHLCPVVLDQVGGRDHDPAVLHVENDDCFDVGAPIKSLHRRRNHHRARELGVNRSGRLGRLILVVMGQDERKVRVEVEMRKKILEIVGEG